MFYESSHTPMENHIGRKAFDVHTATHQGMQNQNKKRRQSELK